MDDCIEIKNGEFCDCCKCLTTTVCFHGNKICRLCLLAKLKQLDDISKVIEDHGNKMEEIAKEDDMWESDQLGKNKPE